MTTNVPEGMMTVEEFGKRKGIVAGKVVEMIRDGFYSGRKVGDDWFIDKSELQDKNAKQDNSSVSGASQGKTDNQEVVVTDIQMPFLSMVVFMVKAAIAFIPAFIILTIIGMLVFGILGEIFGGMGNA